MKPKIPIVRLGDPDAVGEGKERFDGSQSFFLYFELFISYERERGSDGLCFHCLSPDKIGFRRSEVARCKSCIFIKEFSYAVLGSCVTKWLAEEAGNSTDQIFDNLALWMRPLDVEYPVILERKWQPGSLIRPRLLWMKCELDPEVEVGTRDGASSFDFQFHIGVAYIAGEEPDIFSVRCLSVDILRDTLVGPTRSRGLLFMKVFSYSKLREAVERWVRNEQYYCPEACAYMLSRWLEPVAKE